MAEDSFYSLLFSTGTSGPIICTIVTILSNLQIVTLDIGKASFFLLIFFFISIYDDLLFPGWFYFYQ